MDNEWLPTNAQVQQYQLYKNMLASIAKEVRELSKKKQDGVLNITKVRMINRVINPLRDSLLVKIPSHEFLDTLDEDSIPNNSDAVFIISQYETALTEFARMFHITYMDDSSYRKTFWRTEENPDDDGEYEE